MSHKKYGSIYFLENKNAIYTYPDNIFLTIALRY